MWASNDDIDERDIDPDMVLRLIRARIAYLREQGSTAPHTDLAAAAGIQDSVLSEVLNGNRRIPDKLLNYFSLERVVSIRPKFRHKS